MKTNDNILIYMIEQDLKAKGCTCKQLTDVVEQNPTTIEVKANEVVYVHFVHVESKEDYTLQLTSPNASIQYAPSVVINGNSNLISRHWGNIKIKGNLPENYFIHYVRIKL